jgi:anti-sigma factor RsiW
MFLFPRAFGGRIGAYQNRDAAMSNLTTHPTDDVLNDFLLGKLSDQSGAAVERHLSECPECLARAAAKRVGDTLVELLASAGTGRSCASGWPVPACPRPTVTT